MGVIINERTPGTIVAGFLKLLTNHWHRHTDFYSTLNLPWPKDEIIDDAPPKEYLKEWLKPQNNHTPTIEDIKFTLGSFFPTKKDKPLKKFYLDIIDRLYQEIINETT